MPHTRSRLSAPFILAVVSLAALGLAACGDAPGAVEPLQPGSAVSVSASAEWWGLPPFDPVMAELGDEIFEDPRLSINGNQSCETCHDADWGFVGPDSEVNAGGAVYEGSIPGAFGDRKPPSSAYSTLSPVFHWSRRAGGQFLGGNFFDGRATGERLGSPAAEQAQGPFLNPVEQGLRDEACVVYRVRESVGYGDLYLEVFGDAIDAITFPDRIDELCGEEGDPFEIDDENRRAISIEYDNIAIAIAMYEESHNLYSSKFDAWRKGMYKPTSQERKGFALFQGKAGCAECHPSSGQLPAFTDHSYDNLGVPANPDNPVYEVEEGFVDEGLGGFLANRAGWGGFAEGARGKMRVPTLRNVDLRPHEGAVKAYMHNGVFKSLEQVVHFYNTRDVLPLCQQTEDPGFGETCWPAPEVAETMNAEQVGDLGLTADDEAALVAFLRMLSDGYIPNPRGRHLTGGR